MTNKSNRTIILSKKTFKELSDQIAAKIANSTESQRDMIADLIELIKEKADKENIPPEDQFVLISELIGTVIVPNMVKSIITTFCEQCRGGEPAVIYLPGTVVGLDNKGGEGMYG